MKRFVHLITPALALFAACTDASPPALTGPQFTISDAAHSAGKPHFYFLPPLVADPQASGTFDPDLAPAVEICALAGSHCGAVVATFTMTTGSGSETLRLDAVAEHYIVNWHTGEFGLDPAVTYRIRVLVGEVELGFADVDVVSSGQELRNVNTGEFIPLRDGRTLPIKSRIERGFLARIAVTPVAATVPMGETQQFTAVLTDLHGAELGGPPVTWTSSDDAVATIDQTGLATGVRAGVASITAASAGVTGSAELTTLGGLSLVDAGQYHACALALGGQAYCWGRNDIGQLGDGTQEERLRPVAVAGGHRFATVGAGLDHTCGVTTGGQAYCWGLSEVGALGIGNLFDYSFVPAPVAGGLSFRTVSVGLTHNCGIGTGGQAYCWGSNYNGELGDGTTSHSGVPVAVAWTLGFETIEAGASYNCALTTGGQAYCWGYNGNGQLGDGTSGARLVPVAVSGGLGFVKLAAARFHICGVTTQGQTYCWGRNEHGQLGDGTTGNRLVPVPVAGSLVFRTVSTGFDHTCGVTTGGQAYCWGGNEYGQLGDGTTTTSLVPVAVSGGLSFATVAAGGEAYSCGLTTAGQVYCWGLNALVLGDGTATSSLTPVAVAFP